MPALPLHAVASEEGFEEFALGEGTMPPLQRAGGAPRPPGLAPTVRGDAG